MNTPKRTPQQWQLLTSTAFLLGLALLLLNDFLLKPWFHNALTGKLSDFAGVFIFPLFWIALFPRHRKTIVAVTALCFIGWKSPFSQPIIDGWNRVGLFPVGRVVDVTDLTALLMLPIAYGYAQKPSHRSVNISPAFPLGIALFAFGATSYHCSYPVDQSYRLPLSKTEVVQQMSQLDTLRKMDYNQGPSSVPSANNIMDCDTHQTLPDTFSLYLPFPPMDTVYHRDSVYQLEDTVLHRENTVYRVKGVIRVLFQLHQQSDTLTRLHLFRASGVRQADPESCLPDADGREEVIRYFERFVIRPVRANIPQTRNP